MYSNVLCLCASLDVFDERHHKPLHQTDTNATGM